LRKIRAETTQARESKKRGGGGTSVKVKRINGHSDDFSCPGEDLITGGKIKEKERSQQKRSLPRKEGDGLVAEKSLL